jgi:5-methylcytosine-specific restriction enzyme subunit McrC
MTVIDLREWGPAQEVQISHAERQTLGRLAARLDIRWVGADRAQIGPKEGYVGLASVSAALQVVVRPKVAVGSLLDLIALAFRTARLPHSVGEAALASSNPVDWLAFLLVAEIEHLLEQGLRRGYVRTRDEIPYVRGRIAFEALHRTLSRPVERTCEFADYRADIPENRLLRGTLELAFARRLHPEVKLRIATALRALGDVTVVRPSLSSFEDVGISRLNRYYQPALRLCRLFLEGSGIESELGDVVAPAFFVPMEEVFERAVVNALKDEIGPSARHGSVFADRIRHVVGSPQLPINLKPDVVVGPREQPLLVLDAKYLAPIRRHRGRPVFSNANLYQMLSYCAALRCPGMLVYPKVSDDVDVTYEVAGIRVTLRTVDLATPNTGGLRRFARGIGAFLAQRFESLRACVPSGPVAI